MGSHKGHNVLLQGPVKKSQRVAVLTNYNTEFLQGVAKNKLTIHCEFPYNALRKSQNALSMTEKLSNALPQYVMALMTFSA